MAEVSAPRARIALVLAMLMQFGAKSLLVPDLLSRLSFDPLLPLPLGLFPGRWVLPLVMAAISAGTVWVCLKRTHTRSVSVGSIVYAVIDSFLFPSIYAALSRVQFWLMQCPTGKALLPLAST